MWGSLWEATATESASFPSLDGAERAQVAIIGAGFSGLSTAIALADRGVDVVVVDAHQPGWGASGRNGGIVVPAMKVGPDTLVERLGDGPGRRLHDFSGASPDRVFSMIDRFSIDCDPQRTGWLVPAHSYGAAGRVRRRASEQQRFGDPVEYLHRDDIVQRVGSPTYFGGLFDPRGGHLQPLSYARGMARGAASLGVRILADSPIDRLEKRSGGWVVGSRDGLITADHVVIATNGYTGWITPRLARTMVPVHSLLVATEPVDGMGVLRDDYAVSDSRRVLWYYRKDREGRLAFGGRGTMSVPSGPEAYTRIMDGLRRVFPQLDGVRFEYAWAGRVAVNRPHLPQINRPTPGITSVTGFNGRGVAFASAIGPAVAGIAMGDDPEDVSPLPVTPMPVIPLHRFRSVFAAVGTKYYQLRDRLE